MKINVVLILLFLPLSLIAQLVSGPMVGHVTYQEATVWVQCKESSKVQLRYWPVDQIKMAKTTMTAVTMAEHAFTAHLVAGELTPGTTYQYEIWVNGKVVKGNHEQSFKTPAVWRYRGDALILILWPVLVFTSMKKRLTDPASLMAGITKYYRPFTKINPILWYGWATMPT